MRDLRVRYSDTALSDLRDIHTYLSQHDPAAARKIGAAIENAVLLLSLFPQKSRRIRRGGERALPLSRYPFIIFFRIKGDELEILRIRHGARRHPGFQEAAAEFVR
jgi:toxin ParE1/3/4